MRGFKLSFYKDGLEKGERLMLELDNIKAEIPAYLPLVAEVRNSL